MNNLDGKNVKHTLDLKKKRKKCPKDPLGFKIFFTRTIPYISSIWKKKCLGEKYSEGGKKWINFHFSKNRMEDQVGFTEPELALWKSRTGSLVYQPKAPLPLVNQHEFTDLRESSSWPYQILITALKKSFVSLKDKKRDGQYYPVMISEEKYWVGAECNCHLPVTPGLTWAHLVIKNSLKSIAKKVICSVG